MSLRQYQSRPSLYFHSLFGKDREDELCQTVKDLINQPMIVATNVLHRWLAHKDYLITIKRSDYSPKQHWLVAENAESDDLDDEIMIAYHSKAIEAINEFISSYQLPPILPNGVDIYEYKLDTFEGVVDVISLSNPFWLLEIEGSSFNHMQNGEYLITSDDMKYITKWLTTEFSLTSPLIPKSHSYPVDRREDGQSRIDWTNKRI